MRREYFEGVGPVTMELPFLLMSRDGATSTQLGDHPFYTSGRGDNYLMVVYASAHETDDRSRRIEDPQLGRGRPAEDELRIAGAECEGPAGTRRPPTAVEVERGLDAFMRERPPEQQTPGNRERVLVADSLPHYGRIVVGADARIWRERFSTHGSERALMARRDSATTWDVLAATGEWLGVVHTPPAFYMTDAGTDWIVGSFADELDVQVPRKYRLRAAAP